MPFRHKPYHLLLLSFFIMCIAGLLTKIFHIEFPVQDSYHAFPLTYFFWLTALTLLINWFLYVLTLRLLLSKALIWIHILITISCFIFIYSYPYLSPGLSAGIAAMPRRYYDYSELSSFDLFSYSAFPIKVSFIMLTLGQLIYLINLSFGLYKQVHVRP